MERTNFAFVCECVTEAAKELRCPATMKPEQQRKGQACHAKIGPGKKWSGRTTFGCQNWSDPGPLLVAKNGPGCQKWSGFYKLK